MNKTLVPTISNEMGETPVPRYLLEEIVKTLGYDISSESSGPDGKSNHKTKTGLERTAIHHLGSNVLDWEKKLSARESGYNNPELGRRIFRCIRPLLPKYIKWLPSDMIMDALKIYEDDPKISFASYGPYHAGYIFTEQLFTKKADRYSFVFNTSSINIHAQVSGSHWVVLYIDCIQNTIDYFDSMGMFPNELVKESILHVGKVLKKHHPDLKLVVNYTKRRKQMGGNACGIYVVHFVVQRLNGYSFEKFDTEKLPDSEIEKYRKIYWSEVE